MSRAAQLACGSADDNRMRAEIIIRRSGLDPHKMGHLAHDIARALSGELHEIEWQIAERRKQCSR